MERRWWTGFLPVLGALLCAGSVYGADCNGNGVDDLEDVARETSEDCNGDSVPDECEIDPPVFGPTQAPFSVLESPAVLATADFDGDGDLDLVAGSRGDGQSGAVTVFRNEGEREFQKRGEVAAGGALLSMSSADIDRDGDVDVVVAGGTTVRILLNNGAASFEAPWSVRVTHATEFVRAADVDGDGWPDLVTAHPDGGVVGVFLNRRDGTFGAPSFLDAGRPTSVDVADLDGDGNVELIVAKRGSRFLSVFSRTAEGGFTSRTSLDAQEARPHVVLAVDLDRRSGPDVVALGNGTVSVFLNDGNGELLPAAAPSLEGSASSVAPADLDGDGDLDLTVGFLGETPAAVILNMGDRFLRGSSSLPRSRAVVAGDFDADGSADLATLGDPDSLSVLWNRAGDQGDLLLLGAPIEYPVIGLPHAMVLRDLDGDGDLDVATVNNHGGGLSLVQNDGNGAFGAPSRILPDLVPFWIDAADFDRDGDADLATIDNDSSTLAILSNNGSASFAGSWQEAVGANPYHVIASDLDRDGYADLVTANRGGSTVTILHNESRQGGLRFSRVDVGVGGGPVAVASADLNGDGRVDLAVAHQNPPAVTILAGRVGGGFSTLVELATIGIPDFVTIAELDRDGDADLVTAESDRRSISVHWADGRGAFAAPRDLPVRRAARSLTPADLDGDGYLDIIAANEIDGEVAVFLNTRNGSFFFPFDYPAGGSIRSVLTGDVDADGDLDLVSANRSQQTLSVYLNERTIFGGAFLLEICTELDFKRISVGSRGGTVERTGKYIAPAHDDPSLLPTTFQNVARFPLHEEFLREVFWPALSPGDYDDLFARRATREYFSGTVSRIRVDGDRLYTFDIVADTGFDADEAPRLEEARRVHDALRRVFRLEPLAYAPDTALARREAETWTSPPFPVFLGSEKPLADYEPYTVAVTYGRVRIVSPAEFEMLNEAGRFTVQDVLVLDEVPRDIEGVVGGIITAQTQADLSHLAIRTARRGTPNAYVSDAREAFAPLAGKLVRLEVLATEYRVEEAELEEAETFWAEQRPRLTTLPAIDFDYRELDALLEMDLSVSNSGGPVSRYGGKATNLARMQRVLTGESAPYREAGFGIPMHYYLEFLRTNTVVVGGATLTYEQHLDNLLASPQFKSDSVARFEALERFRDLLRDDGVVDQDLVSRLARRIEEVFGETTRMVRFRSSSNLEDSLEFNGAGLYESTSVCAADTLDATVRRSSYCDPTRTDERTIERALKKVWASLWTFRAYEERSFYQIPPERASMGILVTRAFLDERANGVAFTGNPLDPSDRRFVVAAQVGEESVVSPEPGTTVERNLLEMVDGEVVSILRGRASSLVAPGEHVLTDSQLRELGAFMAHVESELRRRFEVFASEDVLLDFEFKIEPDDSLAVKQVRPFLASTLVREAPVFEAVVPPGTVVCGVFSTERTGREPREEYETKSTVTLRPGSHELSSARDRFSADLIEEVLFGADRARAEPISTGEFRLVRVADGNSGIIFRFAFHQDFTLPDGRSFAVELSGLNFTARDGVPVETSLELDDEFLSSRLAMEGLLSGEPVVTYSSCAYSSFPEWDVEVEITDGSSVRLKERFLPSENNLGTGRASLASAELTIGGETRVVTDYWRLVYSARRHNRDIRYWVVLEPPVRLPALPEPVRVVEIEVGQPPRGQFVRYLDEELEVLLEPEVASYEREEASSVGPRFVRGDVTADGRLNVLDSLTLSGYLFAGGGDLPCLKSADADDSGRINLADAILILNHLFGSGAPPAPPHPGCGTDPTVDQLSCERFPVCP